MVNELLEETLGVGAEAIIFKGVFLGRDVVVKQRIPKPYRHAMFDKIFRYSRTKTEAKVLAKLYSAGLYVPALVLVDLVNYIIVMEYIQGVKLSEIINELDEEKLRKYAYTLGLQVGIMHSLNIYHGDLTLSNILVEEDKVYIIDFGLAGFSNDVEEYAIDLHLLKRNLLAIAPDKTEVFFKEFLEGYKRNYRRDYNEVIERLEEIRLRGRYVEERLKRKTSRDKYV
ncbi:MAG: Kae1-associated kinase Bud32 [Desulfurococcales archaeon ex4484_58]|nr:MAG: Kae1-associated kinase Bud32 [Desulfurococcales archaeon ex4484_58]